MAEMEGEFPFGSAQEHALMCEKHKSMPIDLTCEDCEEFICSSCVKENHKDHNWQTIQTAATLKTRGLHRSFQEIERGDIKRMDKRIHLASEQMEENNRRYEIEVSRLQKHYDAIVKKLDKIKEEHGKTLRERLISKNAEVSKARSSLEEKKTKVLQCVKSLKENISTMSDIILLKTHRELTKFLSTKDDYFEKFDFLLRYEGGDINEIVLESMMGATFDVEQILVTETDLFLWSSNPIPLLEAMNEDTCLICDSNFSYTCITQLNIYENTEKQFSIIANEVCVTDNNDVYATDVKNKSISRLFPSGLSSIVFRTEPLTPVGICQTMQGGDLLVTLTDDSESDPLQLNFSEEICQTMDGDLSVTLKNDNKSDLFQPNSSSRRLVRHVTLTGDVIREYEYQEDGQTRLFAMPVKVTQNSNNDICVINMTSRATSELRILCFSGSLKSVYPEQEQRKKFKTTGVVCDSHCNIILSELFSSTIHLLSPEGRFMRYLLTEKQVDAPTAMSLRKSKLWIGDYQGLVKVFQYKPLTNVTC